MKEQKNIDRLFQERFKDFEATPNDDVWSNIEAELKKKQSKRTPFIIPLWYRVAGVAALVALLFWLGQPFFSGDSVNDKVVNTSDKENINKTLEDNPEENSQDKASEGRDMQFVDTTLAEGDSDAGNSENATTLENESLTEASSVEKNNLSTNNSNRNTSANQTNNTTRITEATSKTPTLEDNKNTRFITPSNEENTNSNTNDIANTPTNTLKDTQENPDKNTQFQQPISENSATVAPENSSTTSTILREKENKETGEVAETNAKSLLEEAKKQDEESLTETMDVALEDAPKIRKWEVNSFAAPVYYDGFGDGSTIDQKFADNSTETDVSLAYGVNVAYAISKRLKIRTGVGKVMHSFTTNEVAFGATTSASSLDNVTQSSATGVFVNVVDRSTSQTTSDIPIVQPAQEFVRSNSPLFDGSVNQTLGYIEVPVELEYALLDKRFGINILGGASTLFLSDNNISVSTQGFDTEIGEANNVNNVSFSTNIGLGFNYKITEQVKFNVEPKFKYQVKTFNDSNDFNPYYLGLYTGFSFKF